MAKATGSRGTRKVALIVETSKYYGRELLLGIGEYSRQHGPWSIFAAERGQDDPEPPWLRNWHGDGIITRSHDLTFCRRARARGIAVVSLRHFLERPAFPTFFPDQGLIARRIGEHFSERAFRNLAYLSVPGDKGWERLRQRAFLRYAEEHQMESVQIRELSTAAHRNWESEERNLILWLAKLPKPVGIMVNHDTQGILLLDACRRAHIAVPDEVAVVSVDNDPVLCEIAATPLSSLDQNVKHLGFEAAAALDRMMRGGKLSSLNYFTEPGDVVARQSSETLCVKDPRIAKAVQFVRNSRGIGLNVTDVLRAAGMSRRAFEKRFLSIIGRTPLHEIQEARFREIRKLLMETDYTLPHIAEVTGFQSHEYLIRMFKKRSGFTPGEFRRQMRSQLSLRRPLAYPSDAKADR